MFDCIIDLDAFAWLEAKKFAEEVKSILVESGHEFLEFLGRLLHEVLVLEFVHVEESACMFLGGSAHQLEYFFELVVFVLAFEERLSIEHFREDAADAPNVYACELVA
eukprot:CAMPEP_0116915574 /NCGR_PEP_ID=MMETSP0467-20121206/18012_1 /TAXON_ID=283647 /ORGANISM="Mesodinium pulex, Strain SPMC105" /LENGTH=107 /DNA_ID=CAMNT_0004592269 /DNA_START=148 /DNA_END=471 /DNA_ORIENTATION=+